MVAIGIVSEVTSVVLSGQRLSSRSVVLARRTANPVARTLCTGLRMYCELKLCHHQSRRLLRSADMRKRAHTARFADGLLNVR